MLLLLRPHRHPGRLSRGMYLTTTTTPSALVRHPTLPLLRQKPLLLPSRRTGTLSPVTTTTTTTTTTTITSSSTPHYPLPDPSHLIPVYHGPLARSVRLMKRFSIASLATTLVMAPMVFYIDVAHIISPGVKAIMMSTAIGVSSVSTGLIHWCLSSYVTRILAIPAPLDAVPPTPTPTDSSSTNTSGDDNTAQTTSSPLRDPAIDAADWAVLAKYPIVCETVSLWGSPRHTVVPVSALYPRQVLFGTWHATRIVHPVTGQVIPHRRKKLFVHADAARHGALGEPARVIAHFVHHQVPPSSSLTSSSTSG